MPAAGEQCPFCQLIANPEQLKVVEETDNFYAWLDINPRARGYTMVVPKEHKDSVEDLSPSEYQEAMSLVRKVVDKAKKGLDADGVSVTMNIDEAAGQMVPHAYIQVFPRFEDEETSGTPTGAVFQPHEEAKENLDEIHDKMSSVESDFGVTTKEAHPESKNFKESESSESPDDVPDDEPGGKDEAIDKIGGNLAGTGTTPLSLGSQDADGVSGEHEEQEDDSSQAEEKDEVRIDPEHEGKSFEWH